MCNDCAVHYSHTGILNGSGAFRNALRMPAIGIWRERSFVQIDRTELRLSKQTDSSEQEEEIINRILFLFSFVIHHAAHRLEVLGGQRATV